MVLLFILLDYLLLLWSLVGAAWYLHDKQDA